jgi:hypothetical protein
MENGIGGNPLPPPISKTSFVCSHGLVPRVESKVWVLEGNRNGRKGGGDGWKRHKERETSPRYIHDMVDATSISGPIIFKEIIQYSVLYWFYPSSSLPVSLSLSLSLSKDTYIAVLPSFSQFVFLQSSALYWIVVLRRYRGGYLVTSYCVWYRM